MSISFCCTLWFAIGFELLGLVNVRVSPGFGEILIELNFSDSLCNILVSSVQSQVFFFINSENFPVALG